MSLSVAHAKFVFNTLDDIHLVLASMSDGPADCTIHNRAIH